MLFETGSLLLVAACARPVGPHPSEILISVSHLSLGTLELKWALLSPSLWAFSCLYNKYIFPPLLCWSWGLFLHPYSSNTRAPVLVQMHRWSAVTANFIRLRDWVMGVRLMINVPFGCICEAFLDDANTWRIWSREVDFPLQNVWAVPKHGWAGKQKCQVNETFPLCLTLLELGTSLLCLWTWTQLNLHRWQSWFSAVGLRLGLYLVSWASACWLETLAHLSLYNHMN